jgi:hypothetical protein
MMRLAKILPSAFEIITEMISEEPAKNAPLCKEAVLASILDCVKDDFLEGCNSEFFDAETAKDIWELWKICHANKKLPIWEDGDGQPAEPPTLKEISENEWEHIFGFIHDEFLWDRDWEIPLFGGNLALVREQPHWPSFQEYRCAKTWLMEFYVSTRINRDPRVSKAHSKTEQPKRPSDLATRVPIASKR